MRREATHPDSARKRVSNMSEVIGDLGCPSQWRTREFGAAGLGSLWRARHSIGEVHAYRTRPVFSVEDRRRHRPTPRNPGTSSRVTVCWADRRFVAGLCGLIDNVRVKLALPLAAGAVTTLSADGAVLSMSR